MSQVPLSPILKKTPVVTIAIGLSHPLIHPQIPLFPGTTYKFVHTFQTYAETTPIPRPSRQSPQNLGPWLPLEQDSPQFTVHNNSVQGSKKEKMTDSHGVSWQRCGKCTTEPSRPGRLLQRGPTCN